MDINKSNEYHELLNLNQETKNTLLFFLFNAILSCTAILNLPLHCGGTEINPSSLPLKYLPIINNLNTIGQFMGKRKVQIGFLFHQNMNVMKHPGIVSCLCSLVILSLQVYDEYTSQNN